MSNDILSTLPHRSGHFELESGLHADLWFDLDSLFSKPREIAPYIEALARCVAPYRPTVICGPLLGGAFLAQSLAHELGTDFYYSEPVAAQPSPGLFSAAYSRLNGALCRRNRK